MHAISVVAIILGIGLFGAPALATIEKTVGVIWAWIAYGGLMLILAAALLNG